MLTSGVTSTLSVKSHPVFSSHPALHLPDIRQHRHDIQCCCSFNLHPGLGFVSEPDRSNHIRILLNIRPTSGICRPTPDVTPDVTPRLGCRQNEEWMFTSGVTSRFTYRPMCAQVIGTSYTRTAMVRCAAAAGSASVQ